MKQKAVARKTLADQDWKTQLVQKYPNIPNGAIVDVIETEFVNFYGNWCEVNWNNRHYYVEKDDLDFSEIGLEMAKDNMKEISKYKKYFI